MEDTLAIGVECVRKDIAAMMYIRLAMELGHIAATSGLEL